MRNSAHYDEPLPRRRRLMFTDRLLAISALVLAAISLALSLLT